MNLPQRVSITDCPHMGRHNGMEGFLEDRYADGTAGINLGYDHMCIARAWKEVTASAEHAVVIRNVEDGFDEAPTEIEASPLVSVSKIEDGRVSLIYVVGGARVHVENATQDDMKSIQTIVQALTQGGL